MANFCTKCGRPLTQGETCRCSDVYVSSNPGSQYPPINQRPRPAAPVQQKSTKETLGETVGQATATLGKAWTAVKNQIGIGDPLINEGDAFEKGKKIIPDCVKPNDSEIPVRQYTIAKLRNRILGIPYTKAIGRIQVTNKRVIFRAPGRSIAGRTTLQQEFSIDEIAGIESRREFVFNVWDFIFSFVVLTIGGFITSLITLLLTDQGDSMVGAFILSFIFEAASCAVFFMIKKQWLLKLFCLGGGLCPMAMNGFQYAASSEFIGFVMVFLAILPWILSMLTVFIYSIRPNLAITVKTKSASAAAIDIRRKKDSFIGALIGLGAQSEKDDHTGYREILPEKDAEISIREIGAMINDIQKLGDFGIEKWKR